MGDVPDGHDVVSAVDALTTWTRAALDADDPPDPAACSHLAGRLAAATTQLTWCRDAALALARTGDTPASWGRLQRDTGTADATLIGRLQRWRNREGRR